MWVQTLGTEDIRCGRPARGLGCLQKACGLGVVPPDLWYNITKILRSLRQLCLIRLLMARQRLHLVH